MKLKLRVWNEKTNRMIYPENSDCLVMIDGENEWCLVSHFSGKFEEIIPFNKNWDHLMMYINNNDKYNKPIYTNDIVIKKEPDFQSVNIEEIDNDDEFWNDYPNNLPIIQTGMDIVTLDRFPPFWLEHEHFGDEGEDVQSPSDWEIAGNKFENPDLYNKI